jgi:hypothetical protein
MIYLERGAAAELDFFNGKTRGGLFPGDGNCGAV